MKNSSKVFYIKKFAILDSEDFEISEIPMLTRRKMSKLNKAAMTTMKKVFDEGTTIQELIFASQYGEFDRLTSIIEQYATENEVSPTQFSSSVHNYISGLFSLLHNITSPYCALSAGGNSLSAGLIKAIASENNDILFCYSDSCKETKSVACLISKNESCDCIKCEFKMEQTEQVFEPCEHERFSQFLTNKIKTFDTPIGTIERID